MSKIGIAFLHAVILLGMTVLGTMLQLHALVFPCIGCAYMLLVQELHGEMMSVYTVSILALITAILLATFLT